MKSTDDFDRIQTPADPAPEVPDEQTKLGLDVADQMAKLTPAPRSIHLHERLVQTVSDERDRLLETKLALVEHRNCEAREKDRLHTCVSALEKENARLHQSHKSMRFTLALTSLTFALGGSLISQFAANEQNVAWSYFGWGLVVCATVVVFVKAVLDA